MHKITLFLIAVIFILPASLSAMPAISCHCFQNREFDPQQPAAADEYLLTTTFNSFQALALGIDKKSIVRAKMSGQTSTDLWLSHWMVEATDQSVEEVRKQHRAAGSWLELARRSGRLGEDDIGPTGDIANDQQLAEAVVKSALIRIFAASKGSLDSLKKKGATVKEMTLSLFVSATTGVAAEEIFDRAHAEGMTWGLVAQRAGIAFSSVEPRLKALSAEKRR